MCYIHTGMCQSQGIILIDYQSLLGQIFQSLEIVVYQQYHILRKWMKS